MLLALYGGGFGIICGGWSRLYAVLSPSYQVLLPLYAAAVLSHFNIRCGFVIIHLYAVVQVLYAVLLTLYAMLSFNIEHYFHILSCIYMISRLLKFGMWLSRQVDNAFWFLPLVCNDNDML